MERRNVLRLALSPLDHDTSLSGQKMFIILEDFSIPYIRSQQLAELNY